MKLHRERIAGLAVLAVQHFPMEFAGLRSNIVLGYLKLHDQPKIQSLAELRAHGYNAKRTLAARLAEFYGSNFNDLSQVDQSRLRKTVDALNEIEWREKQEFIVKQKLSDEQVQKLIWLEHIVDVTDTGVWRRAEFDLGEELYNGERFLAGAGDSRGAVISHWLEDQLISGRHHHEDSCEQIF